MHKNIYLFLTLSIAATYIIQANDLKEGIKVSLTNKIPTGQKDKQRIIELLVPLIYNKKCKSKVVYGRATKKLIAHLADLTLKNLEQEQEQEKIKQFVDKTIQEEQRRISDRQVNSRKHRPPRRKRSEPNKTRKGGKSNQNETVDSTTENQPERQTTPDKNAEKQIKAIIDFLRS